MWVETIEIENIKCFESAIIRLGTKSKPYKWVTLLGENGTGKSTFLQTLALLLSGHRGASKLLSNPQNWCRDKISQGEARIICHQNASPEKMLSKRKFSYGLGITNNGFVAYDKASKSPPKTIGNKSQWEWTFEMEIESSFSAGYGAFRRLDNLNKEDNRFRMLVGIPATERFDNFTTLFDDSRALESFDYWLTFLDYQIAKDSNNLVAKKQKELGIYAVNRLLPKGNSFADIDLNGQIWFNTPQGKVQMHSLSDGFRSIIAFIGDLVWRLFYVFPDSKNIFEEEGVVLIDEIDVHLHPVWQRELVVELQKLFPNIQFIVATHSPIIALSAGSESITYKFYAENNTIQITPIEDIYAYDVDRLLQSEAFGLVSTFSPETQAHIDKYYALRSKKVSGEKLSEEEEKQYQATLPFVRQAFGKPENEKTDLDKRLEAFLKEHLK